MIAVDTNVLVSHPRIYSPPSPLESAFAQIEAWLEAPGLVLLTESDSYCSELRLAQGRICAPQVHDAHIASLCALHDVEELWTVNCDFGRFPTLKVRNPLVT